MVMGCRGQDKPMDESALLELDDHTMDAGRGNAEEALQIRLGRGRNITADWSDRGALGSATWFRATLECKQRSAPARSTRSPTATSERRFCSSRAALWIAIASSIGVREIEICDSLARTSCPPAGK